MASTEARQRGAAERCSDGALFVVCGEEDGCRKPYCRDPPPAAADDAFVVLVVFPRDIPPGVYPHSNAAVLYRGQPWEIAHKFNQDQLEVRDADADDGPGVPGLERATEKSIAECGGDVLRALALHNQTESRRLDPAALETSAWLPRGPLPEAGDATRTYLIDAARAAWRMTDDDEQRTFALVALGTFVVAAHSLPPRPALTPLQRLRGTQKTTRTTPASRWTRTLQASS